MSCFLFDFFVLIANVVGWRRKVPNKTSHLGSELMFLKAQADLLYCFFFAYVWLLEYIHICFKSQNIYAVSPKQMRAEELQGKCKLLFKKKKYRMVLIFVDFPHRFPGMLWRELYVCTDFKPPRKMWPVLCTDLTEMDCGKEVAIF